MHRPLVTSIFWFKTDINPLPFAKSLVTADSECAAPQNYKFSFVSGILSTESIFQLDAKNSTRTTSPGIPIRTDNPISSAPGLTAQSH